MKKSFISIFNKTNNPLKNNSILVKSIKSMNNNFLFNINTINKVRNFI